MISNKKISIISYIILGVFAFFINYWTASRGVFPIDTFLHFDSAVRISNEELPIRDFWIVHGLFVDYMQLLFFKIFGVNWKAYVIHGSTFNSIIALFSYKIFKEFNIESLHAFLLSICVATLAYPVSGTPFLDLHSAFISLFAMYFLLLYIKNNKYFYICISIILLGLAFFSKQVPTGYFILFVSLFLLFYSYQIKSFKPLYFSFFSTILFLVILALYLLLTQTSLQDFFLQLFIFPGEIAKNRQETYLLNLTNTFFNIKFIHLFLVPIILIIIYKSFKKNFIKSKDFYYFLIIFFFSTAMIYHQIYTKNQIFIFFLIPILCAFLIYFSKDIVIYNKKFLTYFIIIICILITFKYHLRFNEQRKFHELVNTNIDNAIEINFEKDFFSGLKWITPNFKNPKKELEIIENFYLLVKKDKSKKMIITQYSFFSSLLDEKFYSPSRTYDNISYPSLNNVNYQIYKEFFKKNITKNKIDNIYIFFTSSNWLEKDTLNHLVFNYLPNNCYKLINLSKYVRKIVLNKCDYLLSKNEIN